MRKCLQCSVDTKNPKFCSHSCSATYSNKGKRKNYKGPVEDCCITCNTLLKIRGRLYCSLPCMAANVSNIAHEKNKKLFYSGQRTPRKWIYVFLKERDGNVCSICGISNWKDKPLRFWVDHIDGNSTNHNPENFRLVCLNCDSQNDTFGAKNMGKGRKSRGLNNADNKI
jgi:hypothetical protein